jgi:hypothetical protein
MAKLLIFGKDGNPVQECPNDPVPKLAFKGCDQVEGQKPEWNMMNCKDMGVDVVDEQWFHDKPLVLRNR